MSAPLTHVSVSVTVPGAPSSVTVIGTAAPPTVTPMSPGVIVSVGVAVDEKIGNGAVTVLEPICATTLVLAVGVPLYVTVTGVVGLVTVLGVNVMAELCGTS